MLGGRRLHRRARRYGCINTDPPVLKQRSITHSHYPRGHSNLHLLKLVTGVDISTRPVNRSGRPGKEVKRRIRTAAAAPNNAAFLLSMFVLKLEEKGARE